MTTAISSSIAAGTIEIASVPRVPISGSGDCAASSGSFADVLHSVVGDISSADGGDFDNVAEDRATPDSDEQKDQEQSISLLSLVPVQALPAIPLPALNETAPASDALTAMASEMTPSASGSCDRGETIVGDGPTTVIPIFDSINDGRALAAMQQAVRPFEVNPPSNEPLGSSQGGASGICADESIDSNTASQLPVTSSSETDSSISLNAQSSGEEPASALGPVASNGAIPLQMGNASPTSQNMTPRTALMAKTPPAASPNLVSS